MADYNFGQPVNFRRIPTKGLVAESSSTEPASAVNGQFWLDTSMTPARLKVRENGAWVLASQTGTLLTTDRGAANGVASLVSGVVPIAQIPTGQTGTTVPLGNDARFTDQRTPTDGSVTGGPAGAGVKIAANTITTDNIAAALKDAAAGVASLRTLGTSGTSAAAGNDARLSDQRTPLDSSVTLAKIAAAIIDAVAGTASLRTLGYSGNAAMPGVARLDQIAQPTTSVPFNGQRITGAGEPLAASDYATRNYVDKARQGLAGAKDPVRAVVTTNVNVASPGATLDGLTAATNDRFLLSAQSTGTEIGIWRWNGAAVPMTRADDADETGEIRDGITVAVAEGTGAGRVYIQQATPSGAPGAWTQNWTWYASGVTYTASLGVQLVGSDFRAKIDTTDVSNPIAVNANGLFLGTVPVSKGGTGGVDAATARANLQTFGRYTVLLSALTAGVEAVIAHNLNTLAIMEPTFIIESSGEFIRLGCRRIDANSIGITAAENWANQALRLVLGVVAT